MTALTKSLEFTQDRLKGEINDIKKNIKNLETTINPLNTGFTFIQYLLTKFCTLS